MQYLYLYSFIYILLFIFILKLTQMFIKLRHKYHNELDQKIKEKYNDINRTYQIEFNYSQLSTINIFIFIYLSYIFFL
jgi:hypothetical protein